MPTIWSPARQSDIIDNMDMDPDPLNSAVLRPLRSKASAASAQEKYYHNRITSTIKPEQSRNLISPDDVTAFNQSHRSLYERNMDATNTTPTLFSGQIESLASLLSHSNDPQSTALHRRTIVDAPAPRKSQPNSSSGAIKAKMFQTESEDDTSVNGIVQPQTFTVGRVKVPEIELDPYDDLSRLSDPFGIGGMFPFNSEPGSSVVKNISQMIASASSFEVHMVDIPHGLEAEQQDAVQQQSNTQTQQQILSLQSQAREISQSAMPQSAQLARALQTDPPQVNHLLRQVHELIRMMHQAVEQSRAAETIIQSQKLRATSELEVQALVRQAVDAQQFSHDMLANLRQTLQQGQQIIAMRAQSTLDHGRTSSMQSTEHARQDEGLMQPMTQSQPPAPPQQLVRLPVIEGLLRATPMPPQAPMVEVNEAVRFVQQAMGQVQAVTGQLQDVRHQALSPGERPMRAHHEAHVQNCLQHEALSQRGQAQQQAYSQQRFQQHSYSQQQASFVAAGRQVFAQRQAWQIGYAPTPAPSPQQPRLQVMHPHQQPGVFAQLCPVQARHNSYIHPFPRPAPVAHRRYANHHEPDYSLLGGFSRTLQEPTFQQDAVNNDNTEDPQNHGNVPGSQRTPKPKFQSGSSVSTSAIATPIQQPRRANIRFPRSTAPVTAHSLDPVVKGLDGASLDRIVLRNGLNPEKLTREEKLEQAQMDFDRWREEFGRLRRRSQSSPEPNPNSTAARAAGLLDERWDSIGRAPAALTLDRRLKQAGISFEQFRRRVQQHGVSHRRVSYLNPQPSSSRYPFAEIVDRDTGEVLAPGPGRCGIVRVYNELGEVLANGFVDYNRMCEEAAQEDSMVEEIHIGEQLAEDVDGVRARTKKDRPAQQDERTE